VESRGFSSLIAQELNVGFVPVRKPNKLPYDTISASYELEYGTDTLEIHTDAIRKARVLIHDDVLATGGTKAVCELVEELGGEIVQLNFPEISFPTEEKKLRNMRFFGTLINVKHGL
jgi:adenine phosphoribosyltransferase